MANFYSIITNRGKELEAEALASGTKITLAKFVVGDGNGQAVAPKPTQTKLINEQYRGDIGELSVVAKLFGNKHCVIFHSCVWRVSSISVIPKETHLRGSDAPPLHK